METSRRRERVGRVRSYVFRVALLAVLAAAGHAWAVRSWQWYFKGAALTDPEGAVSYYLTSNSGAHAVGMAEHAGSIWTGIVSENEGDYLMKFVDFDDGVSQGIVEPSTDYWEATGGSVAYSRSRKHVLFYSHNEDSTRKDSIVHCAHDIDRGGGGWDFCAEIQQHVRQEDPRVHVAVATQHWQDEEETDYDYVYAAFWDSIVLDTTWERGMHVRRSTDDGSTWGATSVLLGNGTSIDDLEPTMATNSDVALVAWRKNRNIYAYRTTDHGATWDSSNVWELGAARPRRPCLAACDGSPVFVCWHSAADDKLYYDWSTDNGATWQAQPTVVDLREGWSYQSPNVAMVYDGEKYDVLLTCIAVATGSGDVAVAECNGWFDGGMWYWSPHQNPLFLAADGDIFTLDDEQVNPSVAALAASSGSRLATCVWDEDGGYYDCPSVCRTVGVRTDVSIVIPPVLADNVGRRLAGTLDGRPHYTACVDGNVSNGPVSAPGVPFMYLVEAGHDPALAVDNAGHDWVAYLRSDTLWCRDGKGKYKCVFAGSSSAVPGQPSIVCYPNQANGTYAGNVVFCCYDTLGGSTLLLYARVDTGGVVLDTIESVSGLGDSLPCINIYKSDSLICTWQHSGAVYSALLPDYGPGTSGQPGAWSSPNLVTADGYHAMSVFDGSVLNCVWTSKDGNNFAISRATYDPTSMFAGWTSQSDPSTTSGVEKANPVYAGVGCSVWEQMASGKWTIKGKVRGAEKTLVANDTDAYRPHAVAESVACNPSTDRINLRLLYTAGVTFEVDSGATDTGETRFAQFEYDVSHAGANATAANTGTKLLRKTGGDSLYCLYSDADGAIWYAWSAAGDSWKRDMLVADRDWPAIAEDSSGQRWAVLHGTNGETSADMIEAYYLHNGSWELLQTIFTNDPQKSVGPAALAGASSTSMSIAYAAFKVEGENETYTIRVVKFDGSSLDTCTIASGSSLGDPSITVEPVSQDSDRIHVTWSDNGEVQYRACMDGRDAEMAGNWTSTVNLSNTQNPSVHPFIAADRDWVVVAWAEGDTADIYSRKHSTDSAYNNWQSSVNLSNTSKVSDYPTIAMGDTVIVAWEEHRNTTTDYDILACISFDDTLNIADNATLSSYPHVLFQNKASGDTAIPYLHCIFSESPEVDVYEVGYNKLNLKQAQGEGQQSAGQTPLPQKPILSACQPNPFRDRTQIAYQLPSAGNVRLEVYDVTGRTVRTLASGHRAAGSYTVNWDARDNRGREVPRGVYFYRLDTPGFRAVKKAIVAR